ncbi:unnamed protein product, partial [Mesorhabditis spiculigera]
MVKLDTNYLTTRRGLIRIALIVCGFAVCTLLCNDWYGGKSCFNEGRLGGVSGANFIAVVVNIVFFVLAFLSITNYSFERLWALIGAIVFAICAAFMIWYIIEDGLKNNVTLLPTALVVVEFLLFVWDWQILRGEA